MDCAYGYVFFTGFCIRVQLVRLKRLMRMNTSFARRAPFLHRLDDSFDLAMTVVLDVIRFVRRGDDRSDGCYPIRPT